MTVAPSPQDEIHRPDLVLSVQHSRQKGRILLRLELREGTVDLRFVRKLDREPFDQFKELFEQIEEIWVDAEDGENVRRQAAERIEGLGATLAKRLLPVRLSERLLSYHDPKRDPEEQAPSLLVVSDEPWIPWEVLRLRGPQGEGPFLGEAFAVTRWMWDLERTQALPLDRVALVIPKESKLPKAVTERRNVHDLAREGERQVEDVPARLDALLEGFRSKRFSGWHFGGHGRAKEKNPDLWDLPLDDGELKASDLAAPGCDLSGERPLVFLNACRTARMELAMSGLGGLAEAFLDAGAGAVVGTHWSVADDRAQDLAKAFYRFFLAGDPIGEAARQARLWLRGELEGDPTWLAYTVFADPWATVRREGRLVPPLRQPVPCLEIPRFEWRPERSPPGALLRADHGIVPFHGRTEEIDELREWCGGKRPVRVRLFTGAGGMGKTRLSLQICERLRDEGWLTGFVKPEGDATPEETAKEIAAAGGPLLLVVDYAETRRGLLVPLLRKLLEVEDEGPFRVILLSRECEDWWEQLKTESGGVGDLIAGPATSYQPLPPLASSPDDRSDTYQKAARAFAGRLKRPVPEGLPEDVEAEYFKPVLMLHMSALGAVEGVRLKGEDGILDWVLNRERKFWRTQAEARKLAPTLEPGIGRAMAAITLAGGSPGQPAAIELMEALKFFRGQTPDVLTGIARLLHDTYPGEHWISPVQPDILGEHLIERECGDDPQEIFDLVLGPRADASSGENSMDEDVLD